MRCPDIKIFENYLDGDLSSSERQDFENHVTSCASCREVLEREKQLCGWLSVQPLSEAPAGFYMRVMAGLRGQPVPKKYPDWLFALGIGLIVSSSGFLFGKLGLNKIITGLQNLFTTVEETGIKNAIDIEKSFANLSVLSQGDWLIQLVSNNSALVINLILGGVILCVGLWQMVKALRA